jgi:hypothetical protein
MLLLLDISIKDFQASREAHRSPGSTYNQLFKDIKLLNHSFLGVRGLSGSGIIIRVSVFPKIFPTCSYVLMSEHTRQALSCRKSFGTVSTEPWTSSWDILFLKITLLIIKQKTAPSLLKSGPPLQTS